MKRTLSVLLIGLFVLVAMAAPRPAAAQLGYGPKPRIISVVSSGSGRRTETVAEGQRNSSLDHAGPWVEVGVWVPVTSAKPDRGWFDFSLILEVAHQEHRTWVRDFNPVRLGTKLLGWTIYYFVTYVPFTEGYARLQEPTTVSWGDGGSGAGYRIHQTLVLK